MRLGLHLPSALGSRRSDAVYAIVIAPNESLMSSHQFQSIPKKELACSQLNVALRLYMAAEEYPSIITLAGSAEEVLGNLAKDNGCEPSLKRSVKITQLVCKEILGEDIKESFCVSFLNKARNEMKHKCDGSDVDLDYEHEAAQMLSRALENYSLYFGKPHPNQHEFARKKIARWHESNRGRARGNHRGSVPLGNSLGNS